MQIRYRLTRPGAQEPRYATPGPEWVALVFARSGLGIRKGITLSNGVGVIDSDYRGEIGVGLVNLG